jgi:hypothetical protein
MREERCLLRWGEGADGRTPQIILDLPQSGKPTRGHQLVHERGLTLDESRWVHRSPERSCDQENN